MKPEKIPQPEADSNDIAKKPEQIKAATDIDFEIRPQITSILQRLVEVGGDLRGLHQILQKRNEELRKMLRPGELTDEEAQIIANYLSSLDEIEESIKCLEGDRDALNKALEMFYQKDDEFTRMLILHNPKIEN